MTTINTQSILAMRAQILEKNAAFDVKAGNAAGPRKLDFGEAMDNALGAVNEAQSRSGAISAAYERGETTDIASVMLARQKASIAFTTTLEVRNKLLTAYKDIMSMPV